MFGQMTSFLYQGRSLLFLKVVEVSICAYIYTTLLCKVLLLSTQHSSHTYNEHTLSFTEVQEYLDELKTTDNDTDSLVDTTTAIQSNELNENGVDTTRIETVKQPNVGDGRDFERWLFSDWLNKPNTKGGRQKEPALPILKDAKWNSGDNPVLVTAAM